MKIYLIYIICLICTLSLILLYIYQPFIYIETFETKPKLFIYWEQSWDDAPYICKMCLKSWEKYNKNHFDIIKLDAKNVHNYIDMTAIVPNYLQIKKIAHRSDLLRVNLLNKYNGVWVDATTFCTKPLNSWVHQYNEFFAFYKPSKTKQMSNWFLFSKKKNYIMTTLTQSLNQYWTNRDSNNNYFIFHDIFNNLYDTDVKFKNQWDKVHHISAHIPHKLKYKEKHKEHVPDDKKKHIVTIQSPMYKLDHTDKSSNLMQNSKNNTFYFLAHHHGLILNI